MCFVHWRKLESVFIVELVRHCWRHFLRYTIFCDHFHVRLYLLMIALILYRKYLSFEKNKMVFKPTGWTIVKERTSLSMVELPTMVLPAGNTLHRVVPNVPSTTRSVKGLPDLTWPYLTIAVTLHLLWLTPETDNERLMYWCIDVLMYWTISWLIFGAYGPVNYHVHIGSKHKSLDFFFKW